MERLALTFFDFYQYLLLPTVLIIGWVVCILVGAKRKGELLTVSIIYFWHTLFSCYYWYYTITNTADAVGYYRESFDWEFSLYPGTEFLMTFTSIFTRGFESNYLNTALVFNIFGSLGLLLFYQTLKPYLASLNKFWLLLIFAPSMSFWSAGLGKDSLSFLATCLFIFSIVKQQKVLLWVPVAFLIMFMVRPHIAFMMMVSYVIYFLISSRAHLILKLLILPVIAGAVILSLGFIQRYVGLQDVSVTGLGSYVGQRQSYNLEGGSSVDIASMSYPMQMFTYIFRPLPFEAHSVVALLTSFENTIFLGLFIYLLFKTRLKLGYYVKGKNLWLFLYAFFTCSILAVTTANLGIATRQKWMFMPVLLYLLVYAFYFYKNRNIDKSMS